MSSKNSFVLFNPDAKKHYGLKSSGNLKPEMADRVSGNPTGVVDFKQHFLYFFPLPQGQGSFLPTFWSIAICGGE
jgi:hypothetical protein